MTFPAIAQNAQKDLRFEVFSIKPAPPGRGGGSLLPTPNGFTTRLSLREAILFAYGPPGPPSMWNYVELRNLPPWFAEPYAIDARVSPADLKAWQNQDANHNLLRSALRASFKERCKLAIHEEPAEREMFELVIAKKGLRLKAAVPKADLPQGVRLESGGIQTFINGGRDGWNFYGATIQDLAHVLSMISFGGPVRDRTGLSGRYDFTLRRPAEVPNAELLDSLPLSALGLQLKRGKENRPILVIDHVERPTQN